VSTGITLDEVTLLPEFTRISMEGNQQVHMGVLLLDCF
jgi:hypothetical protein